MPGQSRPRKTTTIETEPRALLRINSNAGTRAGVVERPQSGEAGRAGETQALPDHPICKFRRVVALLVVAPVA